METFAKVEIVGRVARQEPVRYTPSGRACWVGCVAVGPYGSAATWIQIEIWDRAAEVFAEKVRRGDLVRLEGRIRYREWTERRTKQDRRALIVVAEVVSYIERPMPVAAPDPRAGRDDG